MPLAGNPENSTNVQKRQESEISRGRIHGLDCSQVLSLGKRSHISEPEDGRKSRRRSGGIGRFFGFIS
jgi:hypothetical protein